MAVINLLNAYSRKVSRSIGFFLSIILILLIISQVINVFQRATINDRFSDFIVVLFFLLMINGIIFAVNAIVLFWTFNSELREIKRGGFPIQGVTGAPETLSKVKYNLIRNVVVIIFDSFAFGVYLYFAESYHTHTDSALQLIVGLLGVTFLISGSGFTVIADVPKNPSFMPGGLLGYYVPLSLPLVLENFFADSIIPWLDPATRLKFDDWFNLIMKSLNPDYENNGNHSLFDRTERAREQILLLTYLRQSFPKIFTDDVFYDELKEVIAETSLERLRSGDETRITLALIDEIIHDLRDEIPQTFQIIDQLMVTLIDDLDIFRTTDLWVSTAIPTIHSGTHDPFRITVFFLNKCDKNKLIPRNTILRTQCGHDSLDPYTLSHPIRLKNCRGEITGAEKLTLRSDYATNQRDIITELSSILHLGVAVQLQFKPHRFGIHILNLSLEEANDTLWGKSVRVDVRRDLKYITTHYIPKVGAYIGTILSFIGITSGSILTLVGLK